MAKNEATIATVLSFEKKLVPSDGYLYGTTWEKRYGEATPLKIISKTVRGTISNRLKPAVKNDPIKLNAEVEKANLQTVDACSLGEKQDTLKLHFTLKVLGGVENPSACNNETFKTSYATVAKRYIDEEKFTELAKRYALNIANARYLWRNRVGADKIEVEVKAGESKWTFNANNFSTQSFETNDANVLALAEKIASALRGDTPYLCIEIDAYALVGHSQEVYPSEELVFDKGRGDKSKILYSVNEVAALHSQKIGNALRTIDTWYPAYSDSGAGAIAIEPYGAVTTLGKAYRTPKEKNDFFTLFDQYALGESLETKEQEHYVMAVLVRGGVFGKSDKDDA